MPDMHAHPLWLTLVLAIPVAAPLPAQAERHVVRGADVGVYNLAGEIRLESVNGPDVVVEVTRGGADAARLRIVTGDVGGRQTLRVIYPGADIGYPGGSGSTELRVREDGTFGGDGWRGGRRVRISSEGGDVEAHANLRIGVPRGQKLAVHLGVGAVVVVNVESQLLVDVASANVTAQRTRGTLTIDTGSGEVTVTDAEGDLSIDTGSGIVAVTRMRGTGLRIDTGSGDATVSDAAADDVSIDTGSGNVEATGVRARIIRIDTGSGEVRLTLLADAEQIDIDTGSGGVTLAVPESFGAQLEIETGSGGIDLGFPVQTRRLEQDSFLGTIGDGRGSVRIDTGSGEVRVVKS